MPGDEARFEDVNGKMTTDWLRSYVITAPNKHGLTPCHELDMQFCERRIRIHVTTKRQQLRIFVDGKEWKEEK